MTDSDPVTVLCPECGAIMEIREIGARLKVESADHA